MYRGVSVSLSLEDLPPSVGDTHEVFPPWNGPSRGKYTSARASKSCFMPRHCETTSWWQRLWTTHVHTAKGTQDVQHHWKHLVNSLIQYSDWKRKIFSLGHFILTLSLSRVNNFKFTCYSFSRNITYTVYHSVKNLAFHSVAYSDERWLYVYKFSLKKEGECMFWIRKWKA